MTISIVDSSASLSEEDVAQVEERIEQHLPNLYRAFLLDHNGGHPMPGHFNIIDHEFCPAAIGSVNVFFGIQTSSRNTDLEARLAVFGDRIPSGHLPIGNDAVGNLICIATSGAENGCLCFWDHENEADEDE